MTIFDHLFKAVQTIGFSKQTPDQTDDAYLTSLVEFIARVSDEEWNKLPIPAQQWYDQALPFRNTMKPVPMCPGFLGRENVKNTMEIITPIRGRSASEILNVPVSGRIQSVVPNIVNVPKPKKVATGVMDFMRKVVIMHPDWTSRQVWDYMRANGFPNAKLDTISVDGGNIRRVLEIMKEIGWREPVKEEKVVESEKVVG